MTAPDTPASAPSRLVSAITDPLPVTEFVDLLARLETEHGPGLTVRNGTGGLLEIRTPGHVCGCITCDEADAALITAATGRFVGRAFVVCPTCGNKRCPRATHHDLACANSNEPGQAGSAYGVLPIPTEGPA